MERYGRAGGQASFQGGPGQAAARFWGVGHSGLREGRIGTLERFSGGKRLADAAWRALAYLGATQAVKPPLFPPTKMALITSDMIRPVLTYWLRLVRLLALAAADFAGMTRPCCPT